MFRDLGKEEPVAASIGYYDMNGVYHPVQGYLFEIERDPTQDIPLSDGSTDAACKILMHSKGKVDGVPLDIHAPIIKGIAEYLVCRMQQCAMKYIQFVENMDEEEEEPIGEVPMKTSYVPDERIMQELRKSESKEHMDVFDPENKELDSFLQSIIKDVKKKHDKQ